MSKALRDTDYLDHIRDAIARIQRYTAGKLEADFLGNELIQDGVIRNLEIIGEAVTKLSPELKARYGNVPWGEISGMRNRLIHGYISVNLEIVWSTVQKVLPIFLGNIEDIQRQLRQAF
ncbi:MAG: hypothetical protein QG672_1537 [Pseudomonadota bacterium]|nr:DUF86 domain-containing protein [Betaproteobacteria bacterium]MDQ5903944.1 hypothetical protein [Pseudomonadota bacterium]MDQ5947459.1 hypothetical protein [Pseudomonadota bacterium]